MIKYIQSNFNIEQDLAKITARLADGKISDIPKILDNSKKNVRKEINDFLQKNMEISLLEMQSYSDFYCNDKPEAEYFLTICLAWFRDIMMIKMGREESIINIDYQDKLKNIVEHYSERNILKIINSIEKSFIYIKRNVNLRLILEFCFLRLKNNVQGRLKSEELKAEVKRFKIFPTT